MGRLNEHQRKLLEQLMGAEAMGIQQTHYSMWDAQACKAFIAGTCVHDLFTNTKMDLGACPKAHSAKVKVEYEEKLKKAQDDKDEDAIRQLNRIRQDFESEITRFVEECDRRIRAAQRRLEKTPEENNKTTALMREIGEIETALQSVMQDVEQLGSQGKVDESMAQLAKAEALKSEKSDKERELAQLIENQGASGHQKLRVCDICGAYLSILDSDRRLADHFGGKMHLGYHQLRQMMDEWKERGPLPIGPPPSDANGTSAPPPPHANGTGPANGYHGSSSAAPPRGLPPAMSSANGFVPASSSAGANAGSPPHRSSGYGPPGSSSSSSRRGDDYHRSSAGGAGSRSYDQSGSTSGRRRYDDYDAPGGGDRDRDRRRSHYDDRDKDRAGDEKKRRVD